MIPLRGWIVPLLAAVALIAMAPRQHARGADVAMPCSVVRALVIQAGGLDAAIRQAKARGYSEHQIQSVIRECGLR